MNRSLQIIIKDELQNIFDHFCACFNLRIVFSSLDGKELEIGAHYPNSQFCCLLQRYIYCEDKCLTLNEKMRREAEQAERMVCYTCHGGLIEAIYPIFIEQQIMGFAMLGWIRSSKTLLSELRDQWPANRDPAELERAFSSVPFYSNIVSGISSDLFLCSSTMPYPRRSSPQRGIWYWPRLYPISSNTRTHRMSR